MTGANNDTLEQAGASDGVVDRADTADRSDSRAVVTGGDGGGRGVAVSGESAALLSMIERAARDPSIDIDRMERLFKMHEQAEARRAKAAFYSALSEMQADLPAAIKRGRGHNSKSYARFEDVIEALRPAFKQHHFSISYRVRQDDKTITIIGVLAHGLGHTEETEITLPHDTSGGKNAVQSLASSISYGKRYVTLTLTGIATDDDDDGQSAGAAETITEEQAEQIKQALEETNGSLIKFAGYFNIEKLTDLPASKFDAAMTAITNSAKRRAS